MRFGGGTINAHTCFKARLCQRQWYLQTSRTRGLLLSESSCLRRLSSALGSCNTWFICEHMERQVYSWLFVKVSRKQRCRNAELNFDVPSRVMFFFLATVCKVGIDVLKAGKRTTRVYPTVPVLRWMQSWDNWSKTALVADGERIISSLERYRKLLPDWMLKC